MRLEDRFWEKVCKEGPELPGLGRCWVWLGSLNDGGYGRITVNGRRRLAHRVSWEIATGSPCKIDADICHECDNTACVRPSHLFCGNASSNMKDAVAKGRVRPPVLTGEAHWNGLKTHCAAGHPFDSYNTRVYRGKRMCRACACRFSRLYRQRSTR